MKEVNFRERSDLIAVIESVNSKFSVEAYRPDYDDLWSLYKQVRRGGHCSILEYGSGWSTLVLAFALQANKNALLESPLQPPRHPNLFELLTVDASEEFLKISMSRVRLFDFDIDIRGHHSPVTAMRFNGLVSHAFVNVPTFTSDFVYVDGPDSFQVEGDVGGFSFDFGDEKKAYGLPLMSDILVREFTYWPGTQIMFDGRGANAEFFKLNQRRSWIYRHEIELDQHSFVLSADAWGKVSVDHLRFRNEISSRSSLD